MRALSDHDNCLGRHNCITKNVIFEESIQVPFLIRWPGRIKPGTDDLLISTPDLYPTLLELMSQESNVPTEVEGKSFAPTILGQKQERPELVKQLFETELVPWLKKTKDPWLKGEGNFPNM
jgi:arylsulfatase A-like enzyme